MNGFNLSDITDAKFGNVQVSELYFGSTKIWPLNHDYSRDYLTFEALENSVRFRWTDTNHDNSIYYSLDNGSTWTQLTSGSSTPTINTNEKIIFKATGRQTLEGLGIFFANGYFNAMGNIMSLAHGDNFINNNTLNNYQFKRLFYDCYNLVNASNLILPATTLTNHCYEQMFNGCYSLTTAPELPATTLANHCYDDMFGGCFSLTKAPELPATTLAPGCYFSMFISCTSLTTAPELPATTLVSNCYAQMFDSCTSLTTAPELPATTLANHCYDDMFGECTSLTTAPELPATTLTDYCYEHMFNRCTLLNYVKCLATTNVNATNCDGWLYGVSSTGTFVKKSSTSWVRSNSGIPSGWTIQNAS